MQLPIRDRLAFPAGIAPGFDPNHIAVRGNAIARFSAVALAGSLIEVQQGTPGAFNGSISNTAINGLSGPGVEATAAGAYLKFTGLKRAVTFNEAFTLACIFKCTNNFVGRTLAVATSTAANTGYDIGSFNGVPYVGCPGQGEISITGLPNFVLGHTYFFAVSNGGSAVMVDFTTGQTFFAAVGGQLGIFPTDGNYAIGAGPSQSSSQGVGSIAAACHVNVNLSKTELLQWAEDPWSFWYPAKNDPLQFLNGATAANTNASISGAGCSALAGSLAPQDSFTIGGAQAAAQAGSVSVSTASSTSVNISGAQVAAQAGSVQPAISVQLAGAQVAAQAGSVKPAISVPLAGAGAAAQAGSISETDAIGLTGAAVTAAAGTLAPKVSVALSGAGVLAQAGTVSFSGSINAPITGAQVSASAGSVAETDTVPLSGAAVAAQAGQVSFSNAINVPLTGAQANTGAGSLAPAITTKALIGAAAIAQAGAVFSSINLAPLGAAAIGQAGILAETARFSLLGAAAAALAGQVTVSIGAAVLLASARLVRVAGEARTVRLSADARVVTPGAS